MVDVSDGRDGAAGVHNARDGKGESEPMLVDMMSSHLSPSALSYYRRSLGVALFQWLGLEMFRIIRGVWL